jgi:Carboxypeptidase regulatory-like domain
MTPRNVTQNLGCAIAAGAVLLLAQSAAVAQNNGLVQGAIYDADGQPVAGAMVKLKHELRRLTFMVVTGEQGRFEAKDLPPGQYSVQAIGGDMRSPWYDGVFVNARGNANTKVSLALNYHRGPDLPAAWPQRIPEAQVRLASVDPKDLPEGSGRREVRELP